MKVVGIVGVEDAKLKPYARRQAAVEAIKKILSDEHATAVSSGSCHLGGIDIIAEQVADEMKLGKIIYPPANKNWSTGYKPRNLSIAKAADVVYCITVKTLPEGYKGMRFPICYHCRTSDHVKSGGCWTVKQAKMLGKPGHVIVLD
jgi:hypothetical protein